MIDILKKKTGIYFGYLVLILLAGTACSQKKQLFQSPDGYDINNPEIFKMPPHLKEISGIAFYKGDSNMIYAEEDEDGKIYYFHLGSENIGVAKFGKHGDYEDIAIVNEQVILLRSDGVFFVFAYADAQKEKIGNVKIIDSLLPEGEFEGLYADQASNQLYVLCKHCSDDKTSKKVSGFVFTLSAAGKLSRTGNFSIRVKEIEALGNTGKINFHPSALAQNPVTKNWFILSAVNKLLVETDPQFKPIHVYPLDPYLFNQAEGIAFDRENNLYISNERGETSYATILKFKWKKK